MAPIHNKIGQRGSRNTDIVRKIGHKRETRDGCVTYKKIDVDEIMGAVQAGIRHTIHDSTRQQETISSATSSRVSILQDDPPTFVPDDDRDAEKHVHETKVRIKTSNHQHASSASAPHQFKKDHERYLGKPAHEETHYQQDTPKHGRSLRMIWKKKKRYRLSVQYPSRDQSRFYDIGRFKFKAYAPTTFSRVRLVMGVTPQQFIMSLTEHPLRPLGACGGSKSVFYRTQDNNFLVKTIDHYECLFLRKLLLKKYFSTIISSDKSSFLPRFYGLYCCKHMLRHKRVHIVVMNNLFPSTIQIDERYDLKGSTRNRFASDQEKWKQLPTYKDVEFLLHYPHGINLDSSIFHLVIDTIHNDCQLLRQLHIMDYSLLVGVYNKSKAKLEHSVDPIDTMSQLVYTGPQQHSTSPVSLLNVPLALVPTLSLQGIPNLDRLKPHAIAGENSSGEKLQLYIGIIDILQCYTWKRKMERWGKTRCHDPLAVSVNPPGVYANRLTAFASSKIFSPMYTRKTERESTRELAVAPTHRVKDAEVRQDSTVRARVEGYKTGGAYRCRKESEASRGPLVPPGGSISKVDSSSGRSRFRSQGVQMEASHKTTSTMTDTLWWDVSDKWHHGGGPSLRDTRCKKIARSTPL